VRRDLDEIQFGLFCNPVRGGDADDADLLSVRAYQPDLRRRDLAVDPGFLFLCYATNSPVSSILRRAPHAGRL
jgi:hypothetical protein